MDVHRLSRQSPFHYLNTTLKIINKNVSMVRANWNSYIPQVLHKQFSMSTHTSIRGEQNKRKYENCPTALIRQNPSKKYFLCKYSRYKSNKPGRHLHRVAVLNVKGQLCMICDYKFQLQSRSWKWQFLDDTCGFHS